MYSVQSYFRSLYLTHGLIVFVLGGCLAFSKWEIIPYREDEFDVPFLVSDVIIIFLGLIYSLIYFRKKCKSAKYKRGLLEKLITYRNGLWVCWFIMLIMTLFSMAAYIMTGDDKFVYISLFCIILILLNRASISRTIKNLNLSDEDAKVLKNPYSAL